ncbi:anhydro-N-acetylmuramic acid kinase [Empedobacter falsenii]|uniref:anhydro-N-acetylmuramic acid kinase n=1 Tax=Empedobacter falsenii TaxID=343874 RepID=UPI002575DA52|nr:anhydro-N-acetylmuramic acid kinase [Empedobacter falsenii]MDM1297307.1 anhydro-N-acetylmuramic acid kinase [Empedobacter falsenii]MDM1317101.1 anhydro-N-acetylmuramic acid kinase [Empedobacter falsenii]
MKNSTFCIGLMSGTSLDGLDICYVRFDDNQVFEILHAETIDYSSDWRTKLTEAFQYSAMDLCQLDVEFGYFLGEKVKEFIHKNKIEKVDFVASHGQTIFHQPQKSFTFQIGNGAAIASRCQQKVVCDFRTQDVILGGQGAPLVPIGDELLFSNYEACLNLGGFSNISMNRNGKRIAFDICPINIVLNHYAKQLGFDFDKNGERAEQGHINTTLVEELNLLNYYHQPFPKSLGFEWVMNEFLTIVDKYDISTEDKLRSCVEHFAIQIKNTFVLYDINNVLITGGGVRNLFFINRLRELSTVEIIIPIDNLIDFKEALIFAFLGYRRVHNEINCLASVTGASKDHSSGITYSL